jgi:hypothetical protein
MDKKTHECHYINDISIITGLQIYVRKEKTSSFCFTCNEKIC